MLTNTILIPNVTIHWYKILDPTPQMVSHWLEQYPVSWNPTIVFSFEPLKLEASQSGVLKDIGNLLLLSQTEPMIQHLMDAMHNYYDKRLSRLGYRRLGYYFFNQKHCIRLNLQFVHHSLTLQPKQVEFPFRPLDRFNLNQHLYLAPFGVPVRLVWDKEAILNQHPFPQKLRVGFDCHVVDVDSSALFVFEHKHLDIPEAQFTKNDLDMFSQFYQVMENSMEQPVMIPQQLSQPVEKPSPAERTTSSQSITTQHSKKTELESPKSFQSIVEEKQLSVTKLQSPDLSLDEVGDDDFDFFSKKDPKSPAMAIGSPDPNHGAFMSSPSPAAPTPFGNTPFSPQYYGSSQTPYDTTSPQFQSSPGKPMDVSPSPQYFSPAPVEMQSPARLIHSPQKQFEPKLMEPRIVLDTTILDCIVPERWLPFKFNFDFYSKTTYGIQGRFFYEPQVKMDVVNEQQPVFLATEERKIKPYYPKANASLQSIAFTPFQDIDQPPVKASSLSKSVELAIEQLSKYVTKPIKKQKRNTMDCVRSVLQTTQEFFPEAKLVSLEELFDHKVHQEQVTIGTLQVRKKKRAQDPMVVKLDHPRILVRHHATTLSLEQFSIRFWSKLGLTPMFGPKDVKWCALLPMLPQSQIRPTLTMYMDQMRHLWEMYGFGSLEPLQFGDRDHSLYPVSLQHKTPECLLESYLTVIPAVASQLGLLPRQFCVIYFWTPFTVSAQHVEDLSSIFHRLVGHLGQLLQLPVETLLEYVKMEIITMHEANALLLRPDPSKTFENAVMRLYNRFKIPLEPVSDFQSSGFLYAPSYLLESRIKSEITLTLDRMHLIHPLLVMEPDRVIYLFFGQRTDTVYAIWADATNEFLEQKWFSAPQNTASHLWDHTLRLFSQSEFKIRLVVVSVDGWTPGLLQDWNALSGPSIVPSPQPSEEELDIQTPLVTSLAMNPQPGSFKPGLPPPVVNTILSLSLVDVNLDASLDIIFPEPFQNTYPVQKWTHHQPNQLLFSLQHCRLPYSADKSLLSLSTCYLVQPEERETFASTWQISLLGHHNYSYLVQSCYPQWQQQAKDEHPSVPKQHHLAIVRDVAKQLQPMAAMEDFEWPYLECQRSLDFLSLFSSF